MHEYLEVYGNIIETDIAVTHRKSEKKHSPPSDRNLKIYEKMAENSETMTPRDLFYFANELKDHGQYQRAITYYHHFLSTKQCWIEDEIRTCQYLSDCYRAVGHEEAAMTSLKIISDRLSAAGVLLQARRLFCGETAIPAGRVLV